MEEMEGEVVGGGDDTNGHEGSVHMMGCWRCLNGVEGCIFMISNLSYCTCLLTYYFNKRESNNEGNIICNDLALLVIWTLLIMSCQFLMISTDCFMNKMTKKRQSTTNSINNVENNNNANTNNNNNNTGDLSTDSVVVDVENNNTNNNNNGDDGINENNSNVSACSGHVWFIWILTRTLYGAWITFSIFGIIVSSKRIPSLFNSDYDYPTDFCLVDGTIDTNNNQTNSLSSQLNKEIDAGFEFENGGNDIQNNEFEKEGSGRSQASLQESDFLCCSFLFSYRVFLIVCFINCIFNCLLLVAPFCLCSCVLCCVTWFYCVCPDVIGIKKPPGKANKKLIKKMTREVRFNENIKKTSLNKSDTKKKKKKKKKSSSKASPPLVCDSDACCAVCLEDYVEDDLLRFLPCGHHFHSDCIVNWLKRNKSCPRCRLEIDKKPPSSSSNNNAGTPNSTRVSNNEHDASENDSILVDDPTV